MDNLVHACMRLMRQMDSDGTHCLCCYCSVEGSVMTPEHADRQLFVACLSNHPCPAGVIQGEKGVALDDLVYTCTRLMRQMDGGGMDSMMEAAETFNKAVADAQPLVDATTSLLNEVCLFR